MAEQEWKDIGSKARGCLCPKEVTPASAPLTLARIQRALVDERGRCAALLINAAEQWEMYDEYERASEFRELAEAISNGTTLPSPTTTAEA